MGISLDNTLASRVDRLERENLILKRTGAAFVLAAVLVFGLGTNLFRAPRQISAEKIVLNDSHGRPRAMLDTNFYGAPSLRLLGEDGRDQVHMTALADGSSDLSMYEHGSRRISMISQAGTGTYLSLFNDSPRNSTGLFLEVEGGSGLKFHRDRGGVDLGVTAEGGSQLTFADRLGQERGGIGLDPISSHVKVNTIIPSTDSISDVIVEPSTKQGRVQTAPRPTVPLYHKTSVRAGRSGPPTWLAP